MTEEMFIKQLKAKLHLELLPREGGYYCETYRSKEILSTESLPDRYHDSRNLSTAIFYLLTPGTHSALHKLPGDELYHFYLGDPVELFKIAPDRTPELVLLGHDILNGMKLQETVGGGTIQGARLRKGGNYALLGTTMAPGFDFEDFESVDTSEIIAKYPKFSEIISALGESG